MDFRTHFRTNQVFLVYFPYPFKPYRVFSAPQHKLPYSSLIMSSITLAPNFFPNIISHI